VDVARLAGVSRATVSYVINDDRNHLVSDDTKDRVLKAVEELGYRPNAMAQSLQSGTTRTIGLLIPDMDNPHYWQIAKGMEAVVQAEGYDLLLISASLDVDRELHGIRALTTRRIDGLCLILSFLSAQSQEIQELVKQSKPIVLMSTSPETSIDGIVLTEETGTRQIMEYLISLGHRDIRFIYGAAGDLGSARLTVFQSMLKSTGVESPGTMIHTCGPSIEDGYQSALELLQQEQRPTALLIINDLLAIGAMRAAADLGLHVPNDVSIASFDDTVLSTYTCPRLTSVAMNADEIGKTAAKIIFKRINDPQQLDPQLETIHSQLIVRDSTGPAPQQK